MNVLMYYLEPILREHYHVYYDDIMKIMKEQEEIIIHNEKLLYWSLLFVIFILISINLYLHGQNEKDKSNMMEIIDKMNKKIESTNITIEIMNQKMGVLQNKVVDLEKVIFSFESDIYLLNTNCQLLDKNIFDLQKKINENIFENTYEDTFEDNDNISDSIEEDNINNQLDEDKTNKSMDKKVDEILGLLHYVKDVKRRQMEDIEEHIELFKNGIDGIHDIIDDLCIKTHRCIDRT